MEDKSKQMICPILSLKQFFDAMTLCLEEKCAWWHTDRNLQTGHCAILALSQKLHGSIVS
ncbi:MAG: hypothetical protein HYY09_06910 [Firmicutes bacterium]|nr:hypothetical protein [Bacillota bacterium]